MRRGATRPRATWQRSVEGRPDELILTVFVAQGDGGFMTIIGTLIVRALSAEQGADSALAPVKDRSRWKVYSIESG
jgi:hypothetical protein